MSETPLKTADLVRRAQDGDGEAYERLFARVTSRLLAYVRIRLGAGLGSKLEPADVVQEVYVRAHRDFASFEQRDEGSFGCWLFTVSDHVLRDLADHHGALKRTPPGKLVTGSSALQRVRSLQTNPASRLARDEQADLLVEAMARLDPEEREVLLLRYFKETPVVEIAQKVGRSRATVMRQLGSARLKLGRHLRGDTP